MSESESARILIADDQDDVLQALRLLLKAERYEVEVARSPAGILAALEAGEFDAVLMDLNYARDTTSGREGLDLLARLQATDSSLPVAVMTAWSSVQGAVEAIKRGAYDYVEKPWDNARLLMVLRNMVQLSRAVRRGQRLELENAALLGGQRGAGGPLIIAQSPSMQPVLQLMRRIAPSDANVLITGEHGTGKELIAEWLHANSSRSSKAFVPVNLGGLSEGIFESELFGHVKGAFTDARTDRVGRFELADEGTIFLDEIGNVPMAQQAKLLRVLQTRELEKVGASRPRRLNVRVLSATNVNLREEITAGRFREDLLFRLNTIEIHLPALRERREDILPLAQHFLELHASRYGRNDITAFDPGALQSLTAHSWPGNIRELGHAIERAVLLATDGAVRARDLALHVQEGSAPRLEDMTLDEAESMLIRRALRRYDGNVSQAAKALGLSRSALYRRLESLGR
ncbi:MAG TPA: sigma-54 dependent transcriptional regulator [Gemmatimonadales bacterium]|nr:sigma-54 dependent transcriptional regulator [Gemmatimonadales bacterium]